MTLGKHAWRSKTRKLSVSVLAIVALWPINAATVRAEQNTVHENVTDLARYQAWFNHLHSYPNGLIATGAVQTAQKAAKLLPMISQTPHLAMSATGTDMPTWMPLGPAPILNAQASRTTADASGRVDSIAVSAHAIYLGSAGGGVWESQNNGQSWTPLTDNQPSLSIGAVAVAPSQPSTIYAGTGELHFSSDSYYGHGILKSTDGGTNWSVVGAKTFEGDNISQVWVDPKNADTVLVSSYQGVFKSTDGGQTWTSVLNRQHSSYGLVSDAQNSQVLYASVSTVGIFKSTDMGSTWTQLTGGLPSSSVGTIALASDPSNSGTLYASISKDAVNGYELYGIYKTTDGGVSWTKSLNVPPFFDENYAYGQAPGTTGQGEYDNVIAVDPTNPNHIYAGGVTLIESTDGGQTWSDLTMPLSPTFEADIHPDFHALTFDAQGNLYVGNDGGVWEKTFAGAWQDLNTNLSLTQFYPGISQANNGAIVVGGSQDNGTEMYSGRLAWQHIYDGDGGFTAIDPRNAKVVYAESLPGDIERSTDGGQTFTSIAPNYTSTKDVPWVTPFILSPSNPDTVLVGGDRLYQSNDDGHTYVAISPAFTYVASDNSTQRDEITFIAQPAQDAQTIYVGTSSGYVQVTNDGGQTWKAIVPSAADVNESVTSIVVSPTNAKEILITYGGFSYPGQNHHVFLTQNASASTPIWKDVTGNLPNAPVDAAVVHDGTVYIGTDVGVFLSAYGQDNWSRFGQGLPNTPVEDLLLTPNGTLIAATHGRGMFESSLPTTPILSISTAHTIVTVGQSDTLTATSEGQTVSSQVQWTSSNTAIATVNSSGMVTTKGVGTVTITATYQGTTATLSIQVIKASKYPLYTSTFVLNGQVVQTPVAFTYQNTTYMPIYYIHDILQALGIQDSWNGALGQWYITVAGTPAPLYLDAKTGTADIYVNGRLTAHHVVRVVNTDPYSGLDTTYMPIWYIQQILRSFQIENSWNGLPGVKTLTLTYSTPQQ